jgi:hypothetical protein
MQTKLKSAPHMLIYFHDDDKSFVNIGVRKVNGKWGATGHQIMPIADYDGWLTYLESMGHKIGIRDLNYARKMGTPIIAVAPANTLKEAVEGAAWFMVKLMKGDQS